MMVMVLCPASASQSGKSGIVPYYLPHLALDEAGTFDDTVLQTGECDLVRPPGVVIRAVDEGVLTHSDLVS